MRTVDIRIYHIGRTAVNPQAVDNWLKDLGVSDTFRAYYTQDHCEECGESEQNISTDPAMLIALAAKRCYNAFEPGLNPNVTKVRTELVEYIDNILKSGHGSVLEHASHSFAIEGVSRVFTAEMNRHRAGVGISEASMRYIRFNDIPMWVPDSIKLTEEEIVMLKKLEKEHIADDEDADLNGPDQLFDLDLSVLSPEVRIAVKKYRTMKAVFEPVFKKVEECYAKGQEIWKDELAPDSKFVGKKQVTSMLRRIVPMGVATGAVYTLNLRALRHVLALRSTEHAEEEICHVAGRMLELMVEAEPMILGDFKKVPGTNFWAPKYPKV